ncbi:NEDD8-activating enzyme E1 regulatory subunit, partial [Coemansia aciculifera]
MRSDSDKAKLYDRQLRQESGQTALENARVCVFGSTALAAETLKNLVLPGIGEFVVVDDGVVSEQDTLTNFFVQAGDVGKLRAECIVQGLCELNPDVRGSAVTRSPAELLA